MDWTQKVEVLAETQKHLHYSESVLKRKEIASQTRAELEKKLRRIRKRASDKDLYLAVVGRASTGKSTFINALLGTELLTARMTQMTTSAATSISYGELLEVEVCLSGSTAKKGIFHYLMSFWMLYILM